MRNSSSRERAISLEKPQEASSLSLGTLGCGITDRPALYISLSLRVCSGVGGWSTYREEKSRWPNSIEIYWSALFKWRAECEIYLQPPHTATLPRKRMFVLGSRQKVGGERCKNSAAAQLPLSATRTINRLPPPGFLLAAIALVRGK
jgi:hypothetical protein